MDGQPGQLDLPLHNAMYAEAINLEQARNFAKALACFDRVRCD